MKLSEIVLREAKHREDVSLEKAEELIRKNCKMAALRFNNPMWRGSKKSKEEAYVVHGEQGGRESANTSNYYTIIMDEWLPQHGYPKRSKSIICTNNQGWDYADNYGTVYAIFPYDGVKIGVSEHQDIWDTRISIGGSRIRRRLPEWNEWFEDRELPDWSYEDLVNGIIETIEDPDGEQYNLVTDVFDSGVAGVEDILRDSFDPKNLDLELATTNTMARYEDHGRECWISGQCVAIRHDIWEKLKERFEIKV